MDKISSVGESIPLALRMRAAVATALGAAAAHAKLLADQEEREIEHLMTFIIETEVETCSFFFCLQFYFERVLKYHGHTCQLLFHQCLVFMNDEQLKKLQCKVKHMEDLEHMMEKEHVLLEESKDDIIAQRVATLGKIFDAGISRPRDHNL